MCTVYIALHATYFLDLGALHALTLNISPYSYMDLRNGYNSTTQIYHSLYPSTDLPPETLPLSVADFVLSLLQSTTTSLDTTTAFIDGFTDDSLSYSEFISRVRSLANSLLSQNRPLSKGNVALIVCPPSLHIPVLYFALLSLGVVVFPADPLAKDSELADFVQKAKPSIAFTLSNKIASLPYTFSHGTICLDSLEFDSMLTFKSQPGSDCPIPVVYQTDIAAMISSSATTGPAKIVQYTHRNVIASISVLRRVDDDDTERTKVTLLTTNLDLCLGFSVVLRNVVMAQSLVILEKSKDLGVIMKVLDKYKVDVLFAYPLLVGAMAAKENEEVVSRYDISSLKMLITGGMQLQERHFKLFNQKFPHANVMLNGFLSKCVRHVHVIVVDVHQSIGYGVTEICGGATVQLVGNSGPMCYGSMGRLLSHLQAQIVDPITAHALPPGFQGELWLRGPTIMRGYVEDDELTAIRLDYKEGWFKTGDLCYFDSHGYLYYVDRVKELITYKSYKVSPSELEKVILLHPGVEDVVVAPYEEDGGGEVPMAFVIKKQGSTINESQIMDFVATKFDPTQNDPNLKKSNLNPTCPTRLPPTGLSFFKKLVKGHNLKETVVEEYKKIRYVRFITSLPNFGKENSLPISHQGKIQRKLLFLSDYTQ
ncbi:uncharacterized protein [Phyllobates terribilis]|uniref:uncharacterized protein n=1 Tax=Phyllobates terribilis TaxID=111132 RepID=UPI003CCACED3